MLEWLALSHVLCFLAGAYATHAIGEWRDTRERRRRRVTPNVIDLTAYRRRGCQRGRR